MKSKVKEIFKVIGASVMTVTIASAAFMGVNSIAFAAATQPEIISVPGITPIAEAAANTEANDVASGYQAPNLTVVWDDFGWAKDDYPDLWKDHQPKAGAMGYEEAAEIGARYIWDIFGGSMDGKIVEMGYSALPTESRTYWRGRVFNSEAEMEEGSLYSFTVDAITGERIGVGQKSIARLTQDNDLGATKKVSVAEYESGQNLPANLDEYKELAIAFAQKHFTRTKVVSAEFAGLSYVPNKVDGNPYDKENGTISVYENAIINIAVTDDTGRVADVLINQDSMQIISLDTGDSDTIPGFVKEGTMYDGE